MKSQWSKTFSDIRIILAYADICFPISVTYYDFALYLQAYEIKRINIITRN